ncbi:acyl-CoA dehydrogenase family protein, partial [Williamsia sp.]|uniref:acyl-CoA dehydrogenase family protein n=1 Tax=Williamsia sp. TaxID=1872085 RepID=UPI002F936162
MERALFEPEHLLFRDSYRSFLEQHVAPHHDRWEEQNIVDRDVWIEAGKNGFLAVDAPEEFGGGGVDDFRYQAIVSEESARGGFSGLGFTLHNDVIAPYLLELTNDEQKARWLPGFTSGELITAIAMTEPGTGSDLQGIKTNAKKDGDHWVLNGSKTFITNG